MTTRTKENPQKTYLRWLESQLRDEHVPPTKTYIELSHLMAEKEFVFVIAMDNNRIVDGLDLRTHFANEHNLRSNFREDLGPCSFLEVLIGLSRRMAFIAGGQPPGWAWQLLTNLELDRMSDPLSRRKHIKVQEIMDAVIWRTYSPDGMGGFFPLAWPDGDQTQVELWYQMNSYIEELHPEH